MSVLMVQMPSKLDLKMLLLYKKLSTFYLKKKVLVLLMKKMALKTF